MSSYTITIVCILVHRARGSQLVYHRFSLGKWGALVNSLALIYILPILVFSFFPTAPNPVPSTMNWAILMLGGPIVFATAYYWFEGRKVYTPPEGTLDDYIKQYEETTESENKMGSGVSEAKGTSSTVAVDAADA
jgi:Amino acid permease